MFEKCAASWPRKRGHGTGYTPVRMALAAILLGLLWAVARMDAFFRQQSLKFGQSPIDAGGLRIQFGESVPQSLIFGDQSRWRHYV
jgi:hypothetical protein